MILRLQRNIVSGRLILPAVILLVIALRIHSGIDMSSPVNISILLMHIGAALLLLQINHSFTVIRRRTQLPAVLFLITTGTNTHFFTDLSASIIALTVALCILCAIASCQGPSAPRRMFDISMLLLAATFFWPPSILLLPVFWLAFMQFKSFSWKCFLASLFSLLIVLLLVFALHVWNGTFDPEMRFLPDFNILLQADFSAWERTEILRALYTGMLVLVSLGHLLNNLFFDKIKTRRILYFLYAFCLVAALCTIFFSPGKYHFLSMAYLSASFVNSRIFTLSGKKRTAYLLLFSILLYVGTYFVSCCRLNYGQV
jgi:hypothetical protein